MVLLVSSNFGIAFRAVLWSCSCIMGDLSIFCAAGHLQACCSLGQVT